MDRATSAGGPALRILMVSARYLPMSGGTETHVHEVGSRMVAAGHRVTVLTGDPTGDLPSDEISCGMRVIRAKSWPKGRDWCLAPGLLKAVAGSEGRSSDVVHVQGYHTFAAPFAMLGAVARRVPFVVTFHSGGNSSPTRTAARAPQQAILAPLVARAARLVGVSEFEADHFSRTMGIPRERFVVVPNGASLPTPTGNAAKPDAASPLVVSLGRLERYKGHHRVVAAFSILRQRVPGARLRILGEGPYEGELRALVAGLGLAGHVEIGAIPARDRGAMADFLSGASLVALLSDYEAHPVAVMEALSLGRPVLTSDTSGFVELAARGLVRAVPLDAPAGVVADAMAEECARIRDVSLNLPDWDQCATRLLSIYREVARPPARRPEMAIRGAAG